jgi:hypothetical protein
MSTPNPKKILVRTVIFDREYPIESPSVAMRRTPALGHPAANFT